MIQGQVDLKARNIGVYGGTFDPVHLGHISLAFEIMESRHLDEVWFCPALINPFKEGQSIPIAPQHRLNMLQIAIEGEPRFRINEVELFRQGPSYTIDTLRTLIANEKKNKARLNFYLIIGEDAAKDFHKWREAEEIIRLAKILIGKRTPLIESESWQGSIKVQNALRMGITPTRIMEISSTEIRERLSKGMFCGHLLQRKVLDYIILNDLYS